jgi:Tol biopolymer transport system component
MIKIFFAALFCCLTGLFSITAAQTAAPQAKLFAPDIVSTGFMETSAAFTPDGKKLYFTLSDVQFSDNTIMESTLKNGRWTEPRVAVFSGVWRDSEPFVSPDGTKLFFVSNRPLKEGEKPLTAVSNGRSFPGANIWYVSKKGDNWSEAIHVDVDVNGSLMIYNPSVAANGNLYFSGLIEKDQKATAIFRSVYSNGVYGKAEKMPFNDSKFTFMDPSVSPDEKFIVFAFNGPGTLGSADIYIVKQKDGKWLEPVNLGASVNSASLENAPCLSPDGKTVYFTSMRTEAINFPKQRETAKDLLMRLNSPLNGSRNIWQVDITPWLGDL